MRALPGEEAMAVSHDNGTDARPGDNQPTASDGPKLSRSVSDSQESVTQSFLDGPLRWLGIIGLTIYFVALYGGLTYIQFGLWRGASETVQKEMTIHLPGYDRYTITGNTWLLMLILTIGALGSFIHSATSFADYVGNKKARLSWVVWFLLRPLIGSALALVFYLTLRGGLFASTTDVQSLNIYGFAAIGALTGMFSKQATDKLREIFDNLFKTDPGQGDDARQDKLKQTRAGTSG
jgi:hypothetical protein